MAITRLVGANADLYPTEHSPSLMRACLLLRGLAAGKDTGRPPRILELGCGRGLSLLMYAAALSAECWGVDEEPGHIQHAANLAEKAGLSIRLLSRNLASLAADESLPPFDVIILPDAWSVMGPENRRHLLRLLDARLAAGGVFLLSYAALPGWYAASGARGLCAAFRAEGKAAPLALMGELAEAKQGFFGREPEAAALALATRNLPGAPVCLHPQWQPFHFAEVAVILASARLSWAGHANPLDQMDVINLPADAVPLLEKEDNPLLRETVRDYLLNRNARNDLFVRGALPLSPRERLDATGALRFSLARPLSEVPSSFASPLGNCGLKDELYAPLLDALADREFTPKSVEELEDDARLKEMDSASLLECLTVLLGLGVVHPARSEEEAATARPACAALNAALMHAAKAGEAAPRLASPVLGAGVLVPLTEQLFLASRQGGGESPKEWGEEAWGVLSGLGRRLEKDGAALPYEEAETEMIALAERFAQDRLPLLRALGVTE